MKQNLVLIFQLKSKVITEPKIHVNKKFNPFDLKILKKKILKIGKNFFSNENEIKEEELINIVEIAQINKGYLICVLKNNQNRFFNKLDFLIVTKDNL